MHMYKFLLGIIQLCDQSTCKRWVFLYVDGIDTQNEDELERIVSVLDFNDRGI